jgi:molybdate/tungstate transport system permease protein
VIPAWRSILVAATLLAAGHALLGWLGAGLLTPANNLLLYAANLYVLYCGWRVRRSAPVRLGFFALGYFLLFILVGWWLEKEPLFVLLAVVYASVFMVPVLLGLFVCFVLGYLVFQPYAAETFPPLALGWLIVYRVQRSGASPLLVGFLSAGLIFLALVLLPVLHLLLADSPQTLLFSLERAEVRQAIWLSLLSSALATLVIITTGVPLAYALARSRFRGQGVLQAVIDLPILVPQSVVGIALLTLLGPNSPLGQLLSGLGLELAGRLAGVVAAQVFVAFPFLVKAAQNAFENVPPVLEDVSRTLGAGPGRTFWKISLPLAVPGIFTGAILAWARAISEFGAVILFAPHPQTAPVLAHNEFLKAGVSQARPVAVLLLVCCLWIFVLLQFGRAYLPAVLGKWAKGTGRQ